MKPALGNLEQLELIQNQIDELREQRMALMQPIIELATTCPIDELNEFITTLPEQSFVATVLYEICTRRIQEEAEDQFFAFTEQQNTIGKDAE